uniref:Uncharacterized protein n=1 Tax=Romanomermis culicivorax TaxID=13658 RepID=A0A915ITC3_ROMCU
MEDIPSDEEENDAPQYKNSDDESKIYDFEPLCLNPNIAESNQEDYGSINPDNMCFAQAIVVAIARIHRDDRNPEYKWDNIWESNKHNVSQKRVVKQLKHKAGLSSHQVTVFDFDKELVEYCKSNLQV